MIKKIQDAALLEQIGGGWGIAPPSPTQYSGMSAEEIRRIMEWLQKQQQL